MSQVSLHFVPSSLPLSPLTLHLSYLCLDHVDPSGAECLHAVVDVHHPLTLSHVQHHVQHNVAARPTSPHTATARERKVKGQI